MGVIVQHPSLEQRRQAVEHWRREVREAELAYRALEAKYRAGKGYRSDEAWGRFLDQHFEAKTRLLNAREWLKDAERGRPVLISAS